MQPNAPLHGATLCIAAALLAGAAQAQNESVYIPVDPCRIADTRNAAMGVMRADTSRNFRVYGNANQLGNQGGANCPNPKADAGLEPVAIAAYIVAVPAESSTRNGIFSAYPSDQDPPPRGAGATLNFELGEIIGNTTIATVCNANEGSCPSNGSLGVLARDTDEHLVIDVQGYFFPQSALPGYQLVSDNFAGANTNTVVGQVACPAGKKATGGGGTVLDPTWFMDSSLPLSAGAGWQVRYRSSGQTFSAAGEVYAVCVDAQ